MLHFVKYFGNIYSEQHFIFLITLFTGNIPIYNSNKLNLHWPLQCWSHSVFIYYALFYHSLSHVNTAQILFTYTVIVAKQLNKRSMFMTIERNEYGVRWHPFYAPNCVIVITYYACIMLYSLLIVTSVILRPVLFKFITTFQKLSPHPLLNDE